MIPSLIAAALLAAPVRAAVKSSGYELVYSYPVETSLDEPDLRRALDVWPEMIRKARKTVDIEQFYVTPAAGDDALEPTLKALEKAAKRGVKIRVLLEKKFEKNSADGIARLKTMPHLELRLAEWSALTGAGIIHAKFFIVDRDRAFVGSQNYDWRSLKHIHEMGLAVDDAPVAGKVQSVFDHDWAMAASTGPATPDNASRPVADRSAPAYLVASPWRFNPPGVGDSEAELVHQIESAQDEILVQNLEYFTQTFGAPRRFYGPIDNALRDASLRGVKIKILVSHWGTEEPGVKALQSLAVMPGVEARIITIPEAKSGPIPFARLTHSKYAIFDGKVLWVGTSNWTGGYLDQSRNLELVVKDPVLAARAAAVQKHLWDSPYAAPLEILKTYPKPRH